VPEQRDISLRGLLVGMLVIAAGIAVSIGSAGFLVALSGAPASGPSGAARPEVPAPTLQTAPHQELEAFRREKRERLESAGPLRGQPGRVHIPIERAMEILARRAGQ